MELTTLQKEIKRNEEAICELVSEREGLLSDSEFEWLTRHINEFTEIVNWCATIRTAEEIKKRLKVE